jgi:RimJ/RimL family protein N-acetyltransferase
MSNPLHQPVIQTQRLIFRCWHQLDLDALLAFSRDPAVMQYVGDGTPWDNSEAESFLVQEQAHWQQHGYCRWALTARSLEAPVPIGFCGFVPAAEGLEIGWRLAADQWGQGLATEAAVAAIGHARDHLAASEVVATIQPGNIGSQRVATKAGLEFDKTVDRQGQQLELWRIRLSAGLVAVNINNRKQRYSEDLG